MKNKFLIEPIDRLIHLLLQPDEKLNETDIRLGGFILLLLAHDHPKKFIDLFIYDLTADIDYFSTRDEVYRISNRLGLKEKDVHESLRRLHNHDVFYVEHKERNRYRIYTS